MRTKKHYENMLDKNPDTSIGFTLAADMVYAARHELIDTPKAHAEEEWKNIVINLKRKYGEILTVDEVRHEMSPIITAASAFGRKGGQAKSERKTAAVRENGRKGGRPKLSYAIEVACDTNEGEDFVAWLNEQGHTAKLGRTTGNFIDGAHTSSDERANAVMNRLWNEYCNQ